MRADGTAASGIRRPLWPTPRNSRSSYQMLRMLRRPRSTSCISETGRRPVSARRSVLSSVTKAATLTTESLGSPAVVAGRRNYIARHDSETRVGRNDGDQGGVQTTGVEGIGLDYQYRPTFAWLGALRFAELSPPDAPSADHQSSLGSQPTSACCYRCCRRIVRAGCLQRFVDSAA